MSPWIIDNVTELKRHELKKLSVEQLRSFGVWLIPSVLHVRNGRGDERHVLSINEHDIGEALEIDSYVLITKKGLIAKRDSSRGMSLTHSEGLEKSASNEFRRHVGQLQFAVIDPEPWQNLIAKRERDRRLIEAVVEVAFDRKDNPNVTMDEAVKEVQNRIKRGGH